MSSPNAPPDAPADRRVARRFQPAFGTVCRIDTPPRQDGQPYLGLVWNLSESGVSMLISNPPERGTVLAGELTLDSGDALPVLLQVVHVRPIPTGDYLIGAQFGRPLRAEELKPFLAPPPPPHPVE